MHVNITPVLRGGGGENVPGHFRRHFGTFWYHFDVPPPRLGYLFVIFNDFQCFWMKILQLFAPAGDPRLKIIRKSHFLRKIQKLLSAAGHTHDKNLTF